MSIERPFIVIGSKEGEGNKVVEAARASMKSGGGYTEKAEARHAQRVQWMHGIGTRNKPDTLAPKSPELTDDPTEPSTSGFIAIKRGDPYLDAAAGSSMNMEGNDTYTGKAQARQRMRGNRRSGEDKPNEPKE